MKSIEAVAYSYNDEEKPVILEKNHEELQTILPIDELIGLFANEIAEVVEHDSFEYEHSQKNIHFFRGLVKLHKCQYKINDSGMELGQITLTRSSPFQEEEMIVVERALGALSIHLTNAIDHQGELN
jgi:hypothetical protein